MGWGWGQCGSGFAGGMIALVWKAKAWVGVSRVVRIVRRTNSEVNTTRICINNGIRESGLKVVRT